MFRFKSIDHILVKIKAYSVGSVILAGISLYLGYLLLGLWVGRPPVVIGRFLSETPQPAAAATSTPTSNSLESSLKTYVGSKNSTKYHLPTCIGAKGISEANKVWFATREEAEEVGYTPAKNCKGL